MELAYVFFFSIFWEETLITLPKYIEIIKIRACFVENFMVLNMKNFVNLKTTFR